MFKIHNTCLQKYQYLEAIFNIQRQEEIYTFITFFSYFWRRFRLTMQACFFISWGWGEGEGKWNNYMVTHSEGYVVVRGGGGSGVQSKVKCCVQGFSPYLDGGPNRGPQPRLPEMNVHAGKVLDASPGWEYSTGVCSWTHSRYMDISKWNDIKWIT